MPYRNSSVLTQLTTPRRSPRFLPQQNLTPNPKSAKRSVSVTKSKERTVGSRRSARLNNVEQISQSQRRSPRWNNKTSDKKSNDMRVKGADAEMKANCVVSDKVFGGGRKKERNRQRVRVETQQKRVISDEEIGGGAKKTGNGKRIEVKTKDEGFGGGRKKQGNGEFVDVNRSKNCVVLDEGFGGGATKRKHDGQKIGKGWTKEQELALQKAYLSAKPSPHFWKNVSKLVPGKSQQDCFDRIHCDYTTPPQTQPRSRAKTLNSSPIPQFSISASKLLKPIDKAVGRSNVLKPKNIINQKSVEKHLQRHLKVAQDHEGDIFCVLEPNIEFSINASLPSEALPTPKQLKENKGFVQHCTETSSSSHKKPVSRFNDSCIRDLVSPPVLKKVKNRVMHEKYINQLRCRESKRRAAAMKIIGEETNIQKRDVVKSAKVALVSKARDAINKFQQLQANFMDNVCSSDEDNDDGVEFEDESQ